MLVLVVTRRVVIWHTGSSTCRQTDKETGSKINREAGSEKSRKTVRE